MWFSVAREWAVLGVNLLESLNDAGVFAMITSSSSWFQSPIVLTKNEFLKAIYMLVYFKL